MNPSTGSPRKAPDVEWIADLTIEHAGQVAARLLSDDDSCVFEIFGRRGLAALGELPFKTLLAGGSTASLSRWAGQMPAAIDLKLSGVPIGRYEPSGPLSWWSRRLGLPFGCLTIEKVAFARAYLIGDR